MGPLWFGQDTVPHTTLRDLLPTVMTLDPSGTSLGAEEAKNKYKTYVYALCMTGIHNMHCITAHYIYMLLV